MANQLYDNARKQFAIAGLSWQVGEWRALLVASNQGYTFSASHVYLSDIPTNVRDYGVDIGGGVGEYRSGKVMVKEPVLDNGAIDAEDVQFSTISGNPIGAVVIVKWETNDADSQLIAYLDQATGLVITPNGGDIIVTWDNGTNRIFRL